MDGQASLSCSHTVNNSIKGNANLNIEAIRQTLAELFQDKPMPPRLDVQADNAGDNKCWAMILFLSLLVYYDYIEESFLSFLIVGHTHEDIDQLFSVISRYFKKRQQIRTPQQFEQEMRSALAAQPAHISSIQAVLEWDKFLLPHLVKPTPTGIQHAHLPTGQAVEVQGENSEGAIDTREPHTFWIHKRESDGTVVLHYKERRVHPVWLPARDRNDEADALVTDPEGIVLFGTPPPDPMVTPPTEAPLF